MITTKSQIHQLASVWQQQKNLQDKQEQKISKQAGYTLGRLAHSILNRGRPYSDFTTDVLVAAKNGSIVGDIGHRSVAQ
jgi:hypothetical protein